LYLIARLLVEPAEPLGARLDALLANLCKPGVEALVRFEPLAELGVARLKFAALLA